MWADAFVPGPVMICGITDASATRNPNAVHAKLWVDHRELVQAHFARTNCVSKTRRCKPDKFLDIFGAGLGPGNEFTLAQTVEGMLIPDFTRGFDGAHDGRKIVIRADIVAIDHSGIVKIFTHQADGTYAGGLYKSWRDCECVRGRRTKARGYFGRNHWKLMKHKMILFGRKKPELRHNYSEVTNGSPECPHFLDEPVIEFFGPLARKESNNFASPVEELRGEAHLLNRALARERRQKETGGRLATIDNVNLR